eukprot:jgi/Galph1/3290/GphlegSOOS_G1968.1
MGFVCASYTFRFGKTFCDCRNVCKNYQRLRNVTVLRQQKPKQLNLRASAGASADILPLTTENVEHVLDELRPYLIADGGNVSLAGIDGATVRLSLEGACGGCPSSSVTLRMGIESRLKEKIPEIEAVVQEEASGPELNENNIEDILDEVRPFLKIAGGKVELVAIDGLDGPAPSVSLKLSGGGAAIDSVRLEIIQRLKRNFPKLVSVHYIKS